MSQNRELNRLFKLVVLSMYGHNCVLCGAEATTVHHIVAKGMGGCSDNTRYNPLNGVPVCNVCHENIHSVWGESTGARMIREKVPVLCEVNHETHPICGSTVSEIRKELEALL